MLVLSYKLFSQKILKILDSMKLSVYSEPWVPTQIMHGYLVGKAVATSGVVWCYLQSKEKSCLKQSCSEHATVATPLWAWPQAEGSHKREAWGIASVCTVFLMGQAEPVLKAEKCSHDSFFFLCKYSPINTNLSFMFGLVKSLLPCL